MTFRKNFAGGLIIVFFISGATAVYAQRSLKYENIVKEASAQDKDRTEAIGMYADFVAQNPSNTRANPFFRLAELSASLMYDCKPLKDFSTLEKLYRQSEKYYQLCSDNLNDNEVRKDPELYSPVHAAQKRLTVGDINAYLTLKREKDSLFFNRNAALYNAYTSMLNTYYDCMNLYREVCRNSKTDGDIYVNWEKNAGLLATIADKFDSITLYKEHLREILPNLTFEYLKIENFRSDGFSTGNFTAASVELWDYKTWAVQKTLNYEQSIMPVLSNAMDVNRLLREKIDTLKATRQPDSNLPTLSEQQILRLRNMQDLTPLYAEIEQKNKIVDFMNFAYKTKVRGDESEPASYLYSLTEAYSRANQATRHIRESYPSLGINAADLETVDTIYNRNIGDYIKRLIADRNSSASFTYNKTQIPARRSNGFYRPSNPGYIVKNLVGNPDGSILLSGASINSQGFSVAFVASSADRSNINWLKTTDISKGIYDDCAMAICRTPSGLSCLVSSQNVSDPAMTNQTVVKYDAKGVEKSKYTLPDKKLPLGRYINSDDISGKTLLAFYGSSENWFQDSGRLIMIKLSQNNQELMHAEIQVNGELLDVFPLPDEQFILFGNFITLQTPLEMRTSKLGVFSMIVGKDGEIVQTSIYDNDEPRYALNVKRVTADRFLITGQYGYRLEESTTNAKPMLILTDSKGNFVFENKKK